MKNRRSLSNGKREGSRGNSLRQSEERRRRVEESAGGSVGSNCFISVLSLDFLISLSNIQGCLQQERLIFTDKAQSEHRPRTTEQRSRGKEYCSDSSLDNSSVLFLFWVSCTGSCFMSSCSQNNSLSCHQSTFCANKTHGKQRQDFISLSLSIGCILLVCVTHTLTSSHEETASRLSSKLLSESPVWKKKKDSIWRCQPSWQLTSLFEWQKDQRKKEVRTSKPVRVTVTLLLLEWHSYSLFKHSTARRRGDVWREERNHFLILIQKLFFWNSFPLILMLIFCHERLGKMKERMEEGCLYLFFAHVSQAYLT